MRSHSVTWHPTQVNTPCISILVPLLLHLIMPNPSHNLNTPFTASWERGFSRSLFLTSSSDTDCILTFGLGLSVPTLRRFCRLRTTIWYGVKWYNVAWLIWCDVKVGKGRYSSSWERHLRAMGRHLPYGITQCYLSPDTSEHTPP